MMLTIQDIMAIIPHRYPFLMVDRVLEVEAGVRAVGEKLVTINEPFFQGHFPGHPIMPGVLIVEALAQVGSVALLSVPEYQEKLGYFAGIDRVRFRRVVHPGDTLRLEVALEKIRRGVGKGSGTATVEGEVACEGEFLFALGDRPA
jgi:3-hydroxyacyl-[acyl-carrier-protein] dehydratase